MHTHALVNTHTHTHTHTHTCTHTYVKQGGFQDLQELVVSACDFSRDGVDGLMKVCTSVSGIGVW